MDYNYHINQTEMRDPRYEQNLPFVENHELPKEQIMPPIEFQKQQ